MVNAGVGGDGKPKLLLLLRLESWMLNTNTRKLDAKNDLRNM